MTRVLAALFVALVGCDHGHSHGEHGDEHGHGHAGEASHDHGADDEGPTVGITAWSERLELFAEHPPAVAGRETTLHTHVTVLDDFSAPAQGTAVLTLEGPARVEARASAPIRPGIFSLTFRAPSAGIYRGAVAVSTGRVSDSVAGWQIVVHADDAAAARAHAGDTEPGGRITFLKETQWRIPFATAFATTGAVTPTIEAPGDVGTPPGGTADVGAPLAGRLLAPPEGLVAPGTTVARGRLLATLAPAPASPEASAGAELAISEAQARLAAAEASVARAERLVTDRALPQRELDTARRERDVAGAALAAARRARAIFTGAASGRGAGSFRLLAPIDGVVVEVAASPGAAVTAGERLFRIVDPRVLWITAHVAESEAPRIAPDRDGAYRILGLDEWLPLRVTGPEAGASVVSVGRAVDPDSRTVPVVWALREPDARLRVGGVVQVQIPTGMPWSGVVVPRGAVIDDDGRPVAYVQVEGEAFEERVVRLGPVAGEVAGIAEGIRAGERVVTRGANVVRLAARAGSVPAHAHPH